MVLTHGFVLDEHGRKMSKSLGNVTAPQDVIKQSGADILRMWCCASDYADDLRIGPEILKTTVETYRKLRNTMRWMLGSLAHFREEDRVQLAPHARARAAHAAPAGRARRRRCARPMRISTTSASSRRSTFFMTADLSAFYFDIRKDALYCDPISSVTRRACLTVLDQLFRATVTLARADAALHRRGGLAGALSGARRLGASGTFPEVPASWRNETLAEKWRKVRSVRRVVTGALEIERAQKRIGSSLEAAPMVYVSDPDLFAALVDIDLAEVVDHLGRDAGRGRGSARRIPPRRGARGSGRGAASRRARNARAHGRSCRASAPIPPTPTSRRAMPRRCANGTRCARRRNDAVMTSASGACAHVRCSGARSPVRPLWRRSAAVDQALKLWLLFVFDLGARGVVTGDPLPRSGADLEHRHQLRPVPAGGPLGQWVLLALKAIAVVLLWIWLARATSRLTAVALGLIIGGALGNAIDRLAYGAVADFVLLHVTTATFSFKWYVFNLADAAIVAGVVGLLYDTLLGESRRKSALIWHENARGDAAHFAVA